MSAACAEVDDFPLKNDLVKISDAAILIGEHLCDAEKAPVMANGRQTLHHGVWHVWLWEPHSNSSAKCPNLVTDVNTAEHARKKSMDFVRIFDW